MTNQHPITPPPELVKKWVNEALNLFSDDKYLQLRAVGDARGPHIAALAARWGADQELEACCEWLRESVCEGGWSHHLRASRRTKPPSLKEQALDALGPEPLPETGPTGDTILNKGSIERHRCIRRALEELPE